MRNLRCGLHQEAFPQQHYTEDTDDEENVDVKMTDVPEGGFLDEDDVEIFETDDSDVVVLHADDID